MTDFTFSYNSGLNQSYEGQLASQYTNFVSSYVQDTAADWIAFAWYQASDQTAENLAKAQEISQELQAGNFTLSDLFLAAQSKTAGSVDPNGVPDPNVTVAGVEIDISNFFGTDTDLATWSSGSAKNTQYHTREYLSSLDSAAPDGYDPHWGEAANQAPVLTADDPSNGLVEAGESLTHVVTDGVGSATVQLHMSDADGDETTYNLAGWLDAGNGVYTKDGTYGTASLDTATNVVTYTLHNEEDATNNLSNDAHASDTFALSINDGNLDSAPVEITFDITGTGDWFEAASVTSGPLQKTAISSGSGQQTAETFNFHLAVEGDYLGYEGTVTVNADGDFTGANEQATVLVGGEIDDLFAGTGLLQLAGSTGGAGTEPGGAGYSAAHLSGSSDVIDGGFDNGFVDLSVTLSGQVANDVSTLTVSLTYDYWI